MEKGETMKYIAFIAFLILLVMAYFELINNRGAEYEFIRTLYIFLSAILIGLFLGKELANSRE